MCRSLLSNDSKFHRVPLPLACRIDNPLPLWHIFRSNPNHSNIVVPLQASGNKFSLMREFVVRFLSNLNPLFGGVSTRLVADRAAIV